MRLFGTRFLTVSFAVLLAASSSATAAHAASADRPLSPNPGRNAILTGVSARSATDAWAVGHYRNTRAHQTATLILRWDGATWSKVPSPNPSLRENELFGVTADSAGDAWAVGFDYRHGTRALILRWNGTAWSTERVPTARRSLLLGVSADSAGDAWAVGEHFTASGNPRTLVLHWNGSTWSRIAAPSPGSRSGVLSGVIARSATDAWAVGDYSNGDGVIHHALILHWDGHAWSKVDTPKGKRNAQLFGVSATSANDAWAVGGNDRDPITWHWDGTSWSVVKSRARGAVLSAVSSASATDAWAVGTFPTSERRRTLTLHWNGERWIRVKSPSPSSTYGFLTGVAAVSGTDAWAVGRYQEDATGEYHSLILRWTGTRWRQR